MRAEIQDKLIATLNSKGVAARHGFKPMSSQREYRNGSYRHLNAHRLSQEVVYLPLHEDSNFQDAADSVNLLIETYHQLVGLPV
jgi:dTDP-4-amino-4,6-dideoxygalactose transaminase